MAIFSKRTLQRLLNENREILSNDQVKDHVKKLNRANESSISTEWEVVLINIFSKIFKLVYEPGNLGGKSRCDLLINLKNDPKQSFLADICTVSDEGYENENHYKAFDNELTRYLKKYKLNQKNFSCEIGGNAEGAFNKKKMKLKIPPKKYFYKIFNVDFKKFLSNIANEPSRDFSFSLETEEIKIFIRYNPNQEYFMSHHPSYTTAYSLEKNPIYNSLKRKCKQLKESGFNGPLGILICDGGCHSMRDKGYSGLWCSVDDIVSHFFKKNSSILFIITFTIERVKKASYGIMGIPDLKMKIYTNQSTVDKLDIKMVQCLKNLIQFFPKPVNDADNAINFLKSVYRKTGKSFYGGFKMTGSTLKISSRSLLELLAGRINQDKFFKDYGFIPNEVHPNNKNIFELRLKEGRLIEDIKIEKSQDEDDDWIVIKFGNPDPAIYRFISNGLST